MDALSILALLIANADKAMALVKLAGDAIKRAKDEGRDLTADELKQIIATTDEELASLDEAIERAQAEGR